VIFVRSFSLAARNLSVISIFCNRNFSYFSRISGIWKKIGISGSFQEFQEFLEIEKIWK
jgi:hypothetical protein